MSGVQISGRPNLTKVANDYRPANSYGQFDVIEREAKKLFA